MLEDFISACQSFKSHKLRTILSLLGIVIGIMAVVIITTLASSMYGSILHVLKEEGSSPMNALDIYPEWNREKRRVSFQPDEEYRKGLYSTSNKITNIFYKNDLPVSVLRGSANLDTNKINHRLQGVEWQYLEKTGCKLEYGNYFELSDYASRSQKAIISYKLSNELFPEGNVLGKKFSVSVANNQMQNREKPKPLIFFFEVQGVIKENPNSIFGSDPQIYVPRSFVMSLNPKSKIDSAKVFINDENDYKEVKQKIIEYSNKFANLENSVYVYGTKQAMSSIDQLLNMIQLILTAIAFVSLFVGGVNIMNIMTATVTERKKEIGIRKAIGATNTKIVVQFLVETITITLTGAIMGVLLGLVISYGLIMLVPPDIFGSSVPLKVQFIINDKGILIAFTVSIFIGIFFGLRPAVKASKLDPIVALS